MRSQKFYPVVDRIPYLQRCELGLTASRGALPSLDLPAMDVHAILTGEKRCPKKGEWYLSGAIPGAYCAPNDLSMVFHIVKLVKTKTETVQVITIIDQPCNELEGSADD